MELNFKRFGDGPSLIILHGLFGSLDNWQSLGKQFAENFDVLLVDERNHGRSPHSEEFSYDLMADDLYELCIKEGLSDVYLVGHSMGGKTAIRFAQKYPHLLKKLVIVDIGIKEYPMHHEHILAGLHAVDAENCSGRSEARERIAEHIDSEGVRQFLLKNLYWKEKEQMAWRFNLDVLERKMPEILSSMPEESVRIPSMFIRGDQSNYILDDDFEDLKRLFPSCKIVTFVGSGHWVHADNPVKFHDEIIAFWRE